MKWGTISFFGVRLREAARWSCQRPSGQLANAHRQERTTKEYLRADRLALRRSPRSRSERIQPKAGAPSVALRRSDHLPANEEGVRGSTGARLVVRTKSVTRPLRFPAELQGGIPRSLTNGGTLEV
jgi:hypothetical protein